MNGPKMIISEEAFVDDTFVEPLEDKDVHAGDSQELDISGGASTSASLTSRQNPQGFDEEHKVVAQLRAMVLFVICCASVAISVGVYLLTSRSQAEEFKQQFEGAALIVIGSFERIVDEKLTAISSLSLQASLHAVVENQTWPFVTVPDFQTRSAMVRKLSGALFTRIVPIVKNEDRAKWEDYSVANTWWIDEANQYSRDGGVHFIDYPNRQLEEQANPGARQDNSINFSSGISNKIFDFNKTGSIVPSDKDQDQYFPLWQESPSFGRDLSNYDMTYYPYFRDFIFKSLETKEMCIGGLDTAPPGDITHPDLTTSYYSYLLSYANKTIVPYNGYPMSTTFIPIFKDFEAEDREMVGFVFAVFEWSFYFKRLLPPNFPGLVVVLENNCEGAFTYNLVGSGVDFAGKGDMHDKKFDGKFEKNVDFSGARIGQDSALKILLNQDVCSYKLSVYPSTVLESQYLTSLPAVMTGAVALIMLFTMSLFLIFNRFVERRRAITEHQAVRSTAIVSSIFPEAVRERLMEDKSAMLSGKNKLRSIFGGDSNEVGVDHASEPIADLFPFCTVCFMDIAGFTAYSSTRDPSQIFILLETIYQAFDGVAKRRGVFKEEVRIAFVIVSLGFNYPCSQTIGDSYVAVTGLPNPNDRHAEAMAIFASDCMKKFHALTKQMECSLGPDTGDLGLRCGLHSGPVTGGVLRGSKAHFQLFGDTVNSAARMEQTSQRNQIQISQETARILGKGDMENWLSPRSDPVHAKGKGVLSTFWLRNPNEKTVVTLTDAFDANLEGMANVRELKKDRLVDWVFHIFSKHISKINARRDPSLKLSQEKEDLIYRPPEGPTGLDEVAEVISMPEFDAKAAARAKKRGQFEVDPVVKDN